MDDIPYLISGTEKVRNLEKDLEQELNDLKSEIEENEVVHGIKRSISSVPIPKDVSYFRTERQQLLKRATSVSEAKTLAVQATKMQEELDAALTSDYTVETMPLLLHQYFTDRMHALVQCKHMHMLRWKRFCAHTSTLESLYPLYNNRLAQIMSEYNDCIQRAQRLSSCREAFFYGKMSNCLQSVQIDDITIYLRWLVTHVHSQKRFNQFMRVLQWLPILHKEEFETTHDNTEEEELQSSRIPKRFQDDYHSHSPIPSSARSLNARTPQPTFINTSLLSTNPESHINQPIVSPAGGGGLASDEVSFGLPLHMNDFESLKPHISFFVNLFGLEINIEEMSSSADEMELYALVNRTFRTVFHRQEHMKTFKTYDKLELGQEKWGADSSMHALKKDATWLPYVILKAERDPHQEKMMVELRTRNNVDEVLRVMSKFLQVTDGDRVQEALRDHAAVVRDPPVPNPVSVTSHRTTNHTMREWRRIYTNPELYADKQDKLDAALEEIDEKDTDNVNLTSGGRSKKQRESYDYYDTVQLLGLDEGEQDTSDPAAIQGAFLSFLQLRHLRLRELQRSCLSILNYFRSVERTLTINDGGLSLESHRDRVPQNHRKKVVDGTTGGGGGLGSHHYLHNTPADFKMAESAFMEFSDVENHDDFYTIDEGRVHVQDQRGYYIMYDCALSDLCTLESDLLLVASHYIEKDKELRATSRVVRDHSRRKPAAAHQQNTGGFDIGHYSHQEVDRFGVLLDLWANETAYMESKRELLDCYVEAYMHVFDRDEKRSLAQVITNIMYQRPKYDFTAPYFINGYRLECMNNRLHTQFVKSFLDHHIQEQRTYIDRVIGVQNGEFGLPHQVITKQPVAINVSRSALASAYLLEFHPSLAVASRLPAALAHAQQLVEQTTQPGTVTQALASHRRLLQLVNQEWEKSRLQPLGASYSTTTQRDLFADGYSDDPRLMVEVMHTVLHQAELSAARKSQKERHAELITAGCSVLELVTDRLRLIDAACETEVLSRIYRRQAVDMGYDECHLFLRFVQFEYATFKDKLKPPPVFITAVQEDDTAVDRYLPSTLSLAIHELDESHVGHFTFRSRDGIVALLRGKCVENVQCALAVQVVHKNALMAAIQQADAGAQAKASDKYRGGAGGRPGSPLDNKSEKSSATAMTGMSSRTGDTILGSRNKHHSSKPAEAFVSIQLEKAASRDVMLNAFIKRKEQLGTVLRNQDKMEEVKRSMIRDFCQTFNIRVMQYSLRSQILAYYNSMLALLKDFPEIRDKYFMLGELNEKKASEDSVKGLKPDARSLKKRPRRVLSECGQHLLNLWFIPHLSEVLVMYKGGDEAVCYNSLRAHLNIVSALHDILQYLCAHARLGSGAARLGSTGQKMTGPGGGVTADWGGTEGIGSDLREIQRQLDHLDSPSDPRQVAEFLILRRDVMFLEFDTAVRHSMRDTFLATGNLRAYQAVTECMHFALQNLSNAMDHGVESVYFNVPEPLEAVDIHAKAMFPWRSFINRDGPYPVSFWHWERISHYMQLCLSGLRETDLHVAHGEILGVSLLMEDVLLSGQQQPIYQADDSDEDGEAPASQPGGTPEEGAVAKKKSQATAAGTQHKLSRTLQPIESYKHLKKFLLLWKRLEVFKENWGRDKLHVQKIDTVRRFNTYCVEYKREMLYPVLQALIKDYKSIARRYGQADQYEGLVHDNETVTIPKGATELEVKTRLLLKLAEHWEVHMITEVRKKLAKELSLAQSERAREESALPTDLWKKPVMKESFTISKPHIAEDFIHRLMSAAEESEGRVSISSEHLSACLQSLATAVMNREKKNYDNYSMYYENLLRVHHQLLYQKEREVASVRDQLTTARHNVSVDVQCELADRHQGLLLEITALRAKIGEMREYSLTQEREIRDKIREEYDDLVLNLFNAAFELKRKFDEFREDLYDDVNEKIRETRNEASEAMSALKAKFGKLGEDGGAAAPSREMVHQEQMRHIERDNHQLRCLVTKMVAMHRWRSNHDLQQHGNLINMLKKRDTNTKKKFIELKMVAEEEVILLRQQLVALRQALRRSEKECGDLRKELDVELQEKKEKLHSAQQRAQSQRQLEEARRANIERLVMELDEKEEKLRQVAENEEKSQRLQTLMSDKIRKDVDQIRRQLKHERSMKLEAFERVDELQTAMYDIESELLCAPPDARPQTALGVVRAKSAKKRAMSAAANGSSGHRRAKTAGVERTIKSVWPPPTSWPANRPPMPPGDDEGKRLQRPKTSQAQLRSRLAEQLLHDLDPPDHHETVMRLKQMEAMRAGGQKVC